MFNQREIAPKRAFQVAKRMPNSQKNQFSLNNRRIGHSPCDHNSAGTNATQYVFSEWLWVRAECTCVLSLGRGEVRLGGDNK